MIVTKKALSRRTILRGFGASLALPLLDGMVPALTAQAKTAAKPLNRFGVVYVPNGAIMDQWTPTAEGEGFEFTPTLKPLEPYRERLLVLSGLNNLAGGGHSKPGAAFLTGVEPLPTVQTSGLRLGISMDQIAAAVIGQETQLASLELGLEGDNTAGIGTCDLGFSCSYNNLSWRSATTPMPAETNPRRVFERLFGDAGTTDPAVRRARIDRDRSILDAVLDDVRRLQPGLAPSDRDKMNEYLESVRDVERRVQNAEKRGARELPVADSPAGIPVSYDEHAKLMFDLEVLAFQTDLTRLITFQIGREQSGTTYPQVGVPDSHHPISHHAGNAQKIANVAKINAYHVTLFAYFLEKLRTTPDGDGTLLDHVTLMYGSALGDGNVHSIESIPILLAGGGAGLKGGRHVRYPKGTRLTRLQLTLLHALGVPADKFGDATESVELLTDLSA